MSSWNRDEGGRNCPRLIFPVNADMARAGAPAAVLNAGTARSARRLFADQRQPDAQRLGAAATTFVQTQLRMQDVREYLLDALGTYAGLQRFTPRRGPTLDPLSARISIDGVPSMASM